MVKRASGSQAFDVTPTKGQNKPKAGGRAGEGDYRGAAKLPSTGLLSPMAPPGSPAKATITGPAANRLMAQMQRAAKQAPKRR